MFIGVPGTTLRKDPLKYSKNIKSFYRFLTGGAGAAISRVIKNITMTLLIKVGCNNDKSRLLILAPTGVATININETTVHSGLEISIEKCYFSVHDNQQGILRNKLSEVKVAATDENSLVSSVPFW